MDKKAFIKYIPVLLLLGLSGIVASNIALSSCEFVILHPFTVGKLLFCIIISSYPYISTPQGKNM